MGFTNLILVLTHLNNIKMKSILYEKNKSMRFEMGQQL